MLVNGFDVRKLEFPRHANQPPSLRLRRRCSARSRRWPRPLARRQTASQLANLRHWSGQGVAPVYEGFDINPDGSFNMWFGYMNRNYEEEIDIPVGADNTFEPGGDRGQPTHFTTRRHVFKVVVPKEFADKQLVWKLTTRGKTEQVIATLKPVWQIHSASGPRRGGNSEKVSSNLPPVVKVDVAPNPSGHRRVIRRLCNG